MRLPISWLKEYVTIPFSPKGLAERLLLSGTKVDSIERVHGESVLVLEITSNRPDCLSLIGIAREVATLTGGELTVPHVPPLKRRSHLDKPDIRIERGELVLSMSSVLLDQVTVRQSPEWMRNRLMASGLRPINAVVDATNYVMLETGIPMHAFDMDRLDGTLSIRLAMQGEKITTLDGITHTLPEGSIVIADSAKIVDLAGIMGGENSGIRTQTSRVLLHVPIYHPLRIRRTSKAIGLRTEGSTRYEKNLDLLAPPYVLRKAASLLSQLTGARVASTIQEKVFLPTYPTVIKIAPAFINSLLGKDIPLKQMLSILQHLGFATVLHNGILKVTVPSFRRDVMIQEDIVEEIGRIVGYQSLPKTLPEGAIPTPAEMYQPDVAYTVKQASARFGFTEHYGYTLTSGDLQKNLGYVHTVALANPKAQEFDTLRSNMLMSLLPAVALNQKYRDTVRLFEYGRVFRASGAIPDQTYHIGYVSTGESWASFRGRIDGILSACHVVHTENALKQGSIQAADQKALRAFGISVQVWYCQLPAEILTEALTRSWRVRPIPIYPPLIHDLTVVIPKSVQAGDAVTAIRQACGEILWDIELLHTFAKSPQKTAYTFRLTYQAPDRTLRESDIAPLEEKMLKDLKI